ncbi:MAG: recombinase family protein [bacterium]|nr:recombinase family protein [bacterium]
MRARTKPLRYMLYVSQCSEDQAAPRRELERQRKVLRELARGRSMTVVDEFEDNTLGVAEDRPGLSDMLSQIEAGKADGILCVNMARLGRRPEDVTVIHELLRRGVLETVVTPYGETDRKSLLE